MSPLEGVRLDADQQLFCRRHLSPMIDAQIDQNQCRRLKGYYGFEHPKSGAGPAVSAAQADVRYHHSAGNAQRRGYDNASTRILDSHL
jgi:hypothetical protein